MDQNVTIVSKARVSMDDAFSAWFEGAFERCLTCCDALDAQGDGSRDVTLLRARTFLRVDRASEALDLLESMRTEAEPSDSELTRKMLIGAARTRLGNAERGLEDLCRIRAVMQHSHPTIQSEVALNIGLAHYVMRNLDAADAALDEITIGADIIHARSLEYKGWVASARGNYRASALLFGDALTRLDECKHYDRFLEANCLQALAHLAVDGLERRPWQSIAQRRAKVRWDERGLSYPLFRLTLSAATFENDIEGRPVEAATEARRAFELAPTPAYRVQALCKRASIARYAHERIAQGDHLHAAVDAFGNLDVSTLVGDERLVSLALSEELANAGRPIEARAHFEAYRACSTTSATLAITTDGRRETYERLVEAQIAEAEARKPEAISFYKKVMDCSTSSLRHAVIAAIRLGCITGNTDYLQGFASVATREVQGSSWIHASLKGVDEASTLARLTGLQNEYLGMMCRGLTNPQIAKTRGRSVNTVRNQVAVLFGIFGVQNRTELIAEYLRIHATT